MLTSLNNSILLAPKVLETPAPIVSETVPAPMPEPATALWLERNYLLACLIGVVSMVVLATVMVNAMRQSKAEHLYITTIQPYGEGRALALVRDRRMGMITLPVHDQDGNLTGISVGHEDVLKKGRDQWLASTIHMFGDRNFGSPAADITRMFTQGAIASALAGISGFKAWHSPDSSMTVIGTPKWSDDMLWVTVDAEIRGYGPPVPLSLRLGMASSKDIGEPWIITSVSVSDP